MRTPIMEQPALQPLVKTIPGRETMKYTLLFLFSIFAFCQPALAAEDPHTKDRETLRGILTNIESAINSNDMNLLFRDMDPKVQITFMTTETFTGRKEIMSYFDRMFKGDNAPLKSFNTKVSQVDPAVFHSDTIVAHGRTADTFTIADGSERNFDTSWTATAMKKGEAWKVVAINFSVNPLENTILDTLNSKIIQFSVAAFMAGLILTWLIGRIAGSKRDS